MGRVLILTGVIVALAAPAALAAAPHFDTLRLYSEAEFTAAIKPYTDSIARNANDAEAHHWLGVAYLYAFQLYRLGLAPYAGGFGGRAIAALERSVQIKADPGAMLALLQAYVVVGGGINAGMHDRFVAAFPPLPLK